LNWAHRLVLQIILEDIQQITGEAVGAVAFAVFLHLASPLASNPSLALSRSTTVHVQQPKRLLPQLGVLVSIWMGHKSGRW